MTGVPLSSPISSTAQVRMAVSENNPASNAAAELADEPQVRNLTLQPHGFQKLPGSLLTLNGMLSVPDIAQVKPVDKFLNNGLSGANVSVPNRFGVESGYPQSGTSQSGHGRCRVRRCAKSTDS
ncbi:MAG: hypothetical protein H7255_13460 [Ramlibacter sp.]|nr:hypothetical protein [Ramlibacter sp.]